MREYIRAEVEAVTRVASRAVVVECVRSHAVGEFRLIYRRRFGSAWRKVVIGKTVIKPGDQLRLIDFTTRTVILNEI